MPRPGFATFFCCALLWSTVVAAQPPNPGDYSAESFDLVESRGHMVAMRDGVRLSVDLYRPDTPERRPALVSLIPYSNNSAGWATRARWFARRGYVVALVDVRGRFDSEGAWDPFNPKHKTDGYDVVEWVARQPWCDGKVGMFGLSYMGWTQWWTATQAPPSLKCIVPEVAPPDQLVNGPYQNGILVGWAMDWAAAMAGRTGQTRGDGEYGGFATGRERDFLRTPYVDLCERRGAMDAPWFRTWIESNLSTADYWKAIAYQTPEAYGRMTVPSLNITGWFDANHPGAPRNYLGVKQYAATPEARRPRLVIGPWVHVYNRTTKLADIDYGPQAKLDMDGFICRWLDRRLLDRENGIDDEPPVHVFVMGRNTWRAEADWPIPNTTWTRYFLHSGGRANSQQGDGRLETTPPSGDEPADGYTYDPADPTPTAFVGGHIHGAADTRAVSNRDDVLVYVTPELTEDVEVVGPISAKLFAATSARDTDWMVRLVDVFPDGRTALLCDGVMRARCRDPQNHGAFNAAQLSEIEPERVYEYTLDFWRGTGNLFQKGHRIRVEISSSYFPYYLRNLNTGDDNVGLANGSVVAKQRVLHDAEHPSHIVLPIVPAPATKP
jgi:putative CocE/NonD family hydrolase